MTKNSGERQSRDTGLALVFVLLLCGLWQKNWHVIEWAIGLLVVTMLVPQLFRPLAGLWFGLSERMGRFGSLLILTLVFLLVVAPVGLVRRLFGYDPLQRNKWKNGADTVFHSMKRRFSRADLTNPY